MLFLKAFEDLVINLEKVVLRRLDIWISPLQDRVLNLRGWTTYLMLQKQLWSELLSLRLTSSTSSLLIFFYKFFLYFYWEFLFSVDHFFLLFLSIPFLYFCSRMSGLSSYSSILPYTFGIWQFCSCTNISEISYCDILFRELKSPFKILWFKTKTKTKRSFSVCCILKEVDPEHFNDLLKFEKPFSSLGETWTFFSWFHSVYPTWLPDIHNPAPPPRPPMVTPSSGSDWLEHQVRIRDFSRSLMSALDGVGQGRGWRDDQLLVQALWVGSAQHNLLTVILEYGFWVSFLFLIISC